VIILTQIVHDDVWVFVSISTTGGATFKKNATNARMWILGMHQEFRGLN